MALSSRPGQGQASQTRQAVTSAVITTKRDARSRGIATVDHPARLYVAPINATLVISWADSRGPVSRASSATAALASQPSPKTGQWGQRPRSRTWLELESKLSTTLGEEHRPESDP